MNFTKPRTFVLGSLLSLAIAAPASAQSWEWSVAPYLWGASISLDQGFNDRDAEIGVDFKDLVDKLDAAFMIHLEAGPADSRFGLLFDAAYVDVSNSQVPNFDIAPGLDIGQIDSSVTLELYEFAGTYSPDPEAGLDLIFGVRRINLETDVRLFLADEQVGQLALDGSYTDAMLGLRYRGWISETWDYRLRGDIAFGDTDLTWNAIASAGWHFGSKGNKQLLLGYRYMDIDFGTTERDNVALSTELSLNGPFVALNFDF